MKGDPKKETELVQMLMNNLTWLHLENAKLKDSKMTFEKLHKEINNAYITHHVSPAQESKSDFANALLGL